MSSPTSISLQCLPKLRIRIFLLFLVSVFSSSVFQRASAFPFLESAPFHTEGLRDAFHGARFILERLSDSKEKAALIADRYCDNAWTEQNKQKFTDAIHRGSNASAPFIKGLGVLGGKRLAQRALKKNDIDDPIDEVKDIYQIKGSAWYINSIIWIILVIIMFIVWLFLLPACCSSVWRKCCYYLWCCLCCKDRDRVRPMSEVKKWKRVGLQTAAIIIFCVMAICIVISAIYSVHFKDNLPDLICQIARFDLESTHGILYDQHPWESAWLDPYTHPVEWRGVDGLLDLVKTVDPNNATSVTATAFTQISQTTDEGLNNYKTTSKRITDASETVKGWDSEIASDRSYCPLAKALALMPTSIADAFQQVEDLVEKTQKTLTDDVANARRSLIKAAQETKDGADKFRDQFKDQSDDALDDSKVDDDTNEKLIRNGYIITLVLSLLPVIPLVWAIVLVALMWDHERRGTSPKKYKHYAGQWAVLWGYFGCTAFIWFLLGMLGLMVLSLSQGGCSIITGFPDHPEEIKAYKALDFMYKDEKARLTIDTCVNNTGNGRIAQALSQGYFDDGNQKLEDAEKKWSPDVWFNGKEGQELRTASDELDKLVVLGGCLKSNLVSVYKNGKQYPNNALVAPEVLFGATHTDATSRNIDLTHVQPEIDLTKNLLQTGEHVKDYAHCIDQTYYNKDPFPLSAIQTQLNTLLDEANKCDDTFKSHYKFCVREICSEGGGPTELKIENIENVGLASDASYNFDPTAYSWGARTLDMDTAMSKCVANAKASASTADCTKYYLNSVYLGARYMAEREIDEHAMTMKLADRDAEVQKLKGAYSQVHDPLNDSHDRLYSIVKDTLKYTEEEVKAINCLPLIFSLYSVVDGYCGGIQEAGLWVGAGWAVLALACFFAWILSYKVFHYFKDLANEQAKHKDEEPKPKPKVEGPKPSPSLLLAAAKRGDAPLVHELLDKKVDPRTHDDYDNTSIHYAAYCGSVEIVKRLLDEGVPVDTPNTFGYTALNIATERNHPEVIKLLIERGADPTRLDEFGETPLHSAARAGKLEAVTALCSEKAPAPTYTDSEGRVAADTAHLNDQAKVEEFLSPRTPQSLRKVH